MTNPTKPSTRLIACASMLQLLFCVEVDVTQAKGVARGKRVFGEVAASETDGTLINITGIAKHWRMGRWEPTMAKTAPFGANIQTFFRTQQGVFGGN